MSNSPYPINAGASASPLLPGSRTSTGTRPHPYAATSAFISTRQASRTWLFASAAAAAFVLCAIHAVAAGADTPRSGGIGYLCNSLVLFGCAAALLTRVRSAAGATRIRWYLFAAAVLSESVGFVPSFAESLLHTGAARPFQTASFNAAEALFMVAAVLFFASLARSIVLMDLLQGLVFLVLRFNLAWSPVTRDHFTYIHLLVGQSVALVLFLVALVACLGAASRAELRFLRTLTWFFGLRLVAFFTADQVSYIWLHHVNSSRWDVVGDVLFAGFALYLLWTGDSEPEQAQAVARHAPGIVVRSLMPSFLALLNLMLGLFLLRISERLAAVAIAVTVVSYVVRTALLHAQAVHERAQLESRNQHLEGLAVRDPLTGIGNRRSLASAWASLQQTAAEIPASLLLLDIDSFKRANDCHGHQHGDHVLITLARKLENVAAGVAGSHCARLGGDEFALLLPGVTPEEAFTLAEAVRALIAAHRFATEGKVSVSVGIASLEAARDQPLETVVCHADEALYRAKRRGRNRVEIQPALGPGAAEFSLPSPLTAAWQETLQ
ncbi:MAG TPA: GGDEF domain-containing protein [Acidobacteriaceae bacterium]|nr:GGDEF domain-containing protein [Acidobacteriaceae bacterium]